MFVAVVLRLVLLVSCAHATSQGVWKDPAHYVEDSSLAGLRFISIDFDRSTEAGPAPFSDEIGRKRCAAEASFSSVPSPAPPAVSSSSTARRWARPRSSHSVLNDSCRQTDGAGRVNDGKHGARVATPSGR